MELMRGVIWNLKYPVLILVLLQISCCDKKNQITECRGYINQPQLLKDFFIFKDSSYWVYESDLGDLDSIYSFGLKETSFWPHKITGSKNTPCYELIGYNQRSIFYDTTYTYELGAYYNSNPTNNSETQFSLTSGILKTNKREIRFVTFGIDSIWSETPVKGGYIEQYPTYDIKGKKYLDVIRLYYSPVNKFDWVKEIVYSKKIGIIQYLHEDGRTWSLKKVKLK